MPTNTAAALLAGAYASDFRATLPKIDKPTLVCAAESPYMSLVVEKQQAIPDSRLEVFEGAGHALFVDNAEQFNSTVEAFIDDLR